MTRIERYSEVQVPQKLLLHNTVVHAALIGALSICLINFTYAEDNFKSSCDQRCVLVQTQTTEMSSFSPRVVLTGDIEPKFSSNIAFQVSGKITERFVEVGDHVTADQVIAKVDPQDQKVILDSAVAALASSEALLKEAKTTFARQDELLKQGFTTRPAYDQALQQLRTQTAAVESAKSSVGDAREKFNYTNLKAGVDGIITARTAEAGQVVQAGQAVFTLAQDGARDAVFDVYEVLLTEPIARPEVQVYLQSDPSVLTQGKVREISPTVDRSSGTIRVKVGLENVPTGMALGAAVVGVGTFKARRAFALPRSALFRWHDAPAVWVLDPRSQSVSPKSILLDRFTDQQIIVSSGLDSGDIVVTAGIQFLHPGQVVDVAKPQANP